MTDDETFNKILQVQEYKSQISRVVVDGIFSKLHSSIKCWMDAFLSKSRKRQRFANWYRLELFGSAAVGTSTDSSDLDVNLIVPPLFSTENFFVELPAFLEQSGFTSIYSVESASVPLICFSCKSMEIDLCFTVVSSDTCPSIVDMMRFTKENFVSKKRGFLATQGIRVAYILKECFLSNGASTSDQRTLRNLDASEDARFYRLGSCARHVLQRSIMFVKSWAQSRGIYGNVFCYPGGISWTIMVIYCFLACKKLSCLQIDDENAKFTKNETSKIIQRFLAYFFIFYDIYFDSTRRALPLRPRIHIYDIHKFKICPTHALSLLQKNFMEEHADNSFQDVKSEKHYRCVRELFENFMRMVEAETHLEAESIDESQFLAQDIVEVLNPAPAYTNSVYNVSISSVQAMHAELHRATTIVCSEATDQQRWAKVLYAGGIVEVAQHFILIELQSGGEGCQKIIKTFESRLKHFLYHLESKIPEHSFRLIPKCIEPSLPGLDLKKAKPFFASAPKPAAVPEEQIVYNRYILSLIAGDSTSVDLTKSLQFLEFALETSESDCMSFYAACIDKKKLYSFFAT